LILPLWIVITEKLKIARCLSWVSVGGAIRATAKRIEADPKDASTKLKESIVFTFFLLLLLYGMQRIHSRDRAPREPHLTTPATLETIELPLDITTDFLPAKQTITVSGGAIDYVGTNLFILAGF